MPEKQNVEWKESWRDDYLQWISGFANTEGGKLYIGINDNGDVIGLSNYAKLMEDLPNKIRNLLGITCDVNLIEDGNKHYIEIVVEPHQTGISYRGKFYKRSGSTTQLLFGASLERFLLKKSNLSWDEIIVDNVSMDDIDEKVIGVFKDSAINTGRVPSISASTSTKAILKNLNLLNDNGEFTRASVLLFGKNPIKFFTTAYLKIGKFGDSPTDLLSQDVIECNAFELTDRTIEILEAKYIVRNISYDRLNRIETPEYPFDAIREILFNAIVHKQYGITPITIRVYDDRISIWNVGELPEQLTTEDLKKEHGSYPRNKLMANAFYKGGHIEAWGRGTLKVIEECEKHGLPEPLIEENGGGVSITLFKDKANDEYLSKFKLKESQTKAVKYVRDNGHITNGIYQELYDVIDRTALRHLDELVQLGVLKKVGEKKGTRYELNH